MATYDALRHFADSWVLLAMLAFFVGACGLAVSRPRALHDDAARAVFRHDRPGDGHRADERTGRAAGDRGDPVPNMPSRPAGETQ